MSVASVRAVGTTTDVARSAAGGIGAALLTFALMFVSERPLAIVWDEGYTLARLERVRAWFQAVRAPGEFARSWDPARLQPVEDRLNPPRPDEIDTRGELLSPRVLDWFWPFAREEPHGHPPFYALIAMVGDVLGDGFSALTRARVGTMLAFSLASGAIFSFASRRWGAWSAAAACGAWVFQPHLFALGHYATYDGLLASLWILATLAFATAVEGRESQSGAALRQIWPIAIFGVLWGWALGTKLTGWFLPIPLVAWIALMRSRRGALVLCAGGVVAVGTLYLFTPPFWPNPIGGLMRFVQSNLSRAQTIPIKTMFLGRIYETPTGSLPWYNTLVWMAIATPVVFFALALLGGWMAVRQRKAAPIGLLFVLSSAAVLILRALPHTPGHDGTRQLAAAFGGEAVLVGLGASGVIARMARPGIALISAAIVEGVVSVALMMPVPLSYFSPIVGGLPGATALGMEPTYYWDSLSSEAVLRINSRAKGRDAVLFVANPIAWYYRKSGSLRAPIWPFESREFAWYVMQNRPGAMSDVDRRLARRLGSNPRYVISEKFGVPLAWAFPASQVEAEFRNGAPGREVR